MPRRIQRKRTKGWRKPAGSVVVTRPCEWSNPFKAGDTIAAYDHLAGRGVRVTVTPTLAVELFRAAVAERGWHDQIRDELEGCDLVCWCPLDAPCHADVLLEVANAVGSGGLIR